MRITDLITQATCPYKTYRYLNVTFLYPPFLFYFFNTRDQENLGWCYIKETWKKFYQPFLSFEIQVQISFSLTDFENVHLNIKIWMLQNYLQKLLQLGETHFIHVMNPSIFTFCNFQKLLAFQELFGHLNRITCVVCITVISWTGQYIFFLSIHTFPVSHFSSWGLLPVLSLYNAGKKKLKAFLSNINSFFNKAVKSGTLPDASVKW